MPSPNGPYSLASLPSPVAPNDNQASNDKWSPPPGATGPYAIGQGSIVNSQASAWGHSGNIPGDYPPYLQPELSSPFWDQWLPSAGALLPSNAYRSPWDIVTLGGKQLPGLAEVTSTRGRRIDIKQAKGKHYATLTFNGYDPAKVKINVKIWTQAQFDVLDGMMPMLEEPPTFYVDNSVAGGKVFQAIDIAAPQLRPNNISQVLIESIDTMHKTGTKGVWEMNINAIEYKVVKVPATSTVQGSKAGYTGNFAITAKSKTMPGVDPTLLVPLTGA